MADRGILAGDTLIVDRSRTPGRHSIVVAAIDGELTVRPFTAFEGADASVWCCSASVFNADRHANPLPFQESGGQAPTLSNNDRFFRKRGGCTRPPLPRVGRLHGFAERILARWIENGKRSPNAAGDTPSIEKICIRFDY